MIPFEKVYKELNEEQKRAVDVIDGPLLVLAGPGTGKTQLLSARVANILRKTDTLPQNILCLTFTEMAALNMRERLNSMIGEAAYDVHISTYHSFGSEIIRSYPEFFTSINLDTGEDTRLEQAIDDLTKTQIISEIINKLPYDNPLIGARHYIGNVVATISEIKRANLNSDDIKQIADDNLKCVIELSPKINSALEIMKSTRKFDDVFNGLSNVYEVIKDSNYSLANQASAELKKVLTTAEEEHSSKALTAWRNNWLTKDDENSWVFTSIDQHKRIKSLAEVLNKYQRKLREKALYDFDDMILKTIEVLRENDELRNNVQERYQYILLDEFQDTNAAQFEMVNLIADHPVHEGSPNVMAVGDDDQAIYAFQGAEVSNMLGFAKKYKNVQVVNLTKNYRSHHEIIHTAHNVAGQIETRLHEQLENVSKDLEAAGNKLPSDSVIERHEFKAQAGEYAWVSNKIKELVKGGTKPEEIAILAPKHKMLEEVVPFLNDKDIPVTYEKRENILETSIIKQFELISKLVLACSSNNKSSMNELFPKVLSLDFWQNSVELIWKINWQAYGQSQEKSWAELALENEKLKDQVLFILALGNMAEQMPLEYMLDAIAGTEPITLSEENEYTSPLKKYYFSNDKKSNLEYFESISHLSVIRSQLRTYQKGVDSTLKLKDFIKFFEMYAEAEQPLINSHPIAQADSSVQLMTVYKAKGLEFENVFLLSVNDDVWGKKARSNFNKLSLPENLKHIRYVGSGEDELRRLLFVAITRAKFGLFLTSFASKDTGKPTEPVKYLREQINDDKTRSVGVVPKHKSEVIVNSHDSKQIMQDVELLWQHRHTKLEPNLKSLIKDRLSKYQMSPTHLNSFTDMKYGGPENFLLQTLLKFPQAPSIDGEYGNSIHQALEWYTLQEVRPSADELLEHYSLSLKKFYIPEEKLDDINSRGRNALKAYTEARTDMFDQEAQSEVDFRSEGAVLEGAHLTGKIDRLEINKADKTLRVVDYKTGQSFSSWKSDLKLHKYKQQLYFYKLLIEKSHTWQNYTVQDARLEFVEPNASGKVLDALVLEFNKKEYYEFKKLVSAVWNNIQSLNLPDTSEYSDDLKGTKEFQEYLLSLATS